MKHIVQIDYIRGVAAIWVLLLHTFEYLYDKLRFEGALESIFKGLLLFPKMGELGVNFFIILSGFCIYISFKKNEMNWWSFWKRRLIRIHPLFILSIFFAVMMLGDVRFSYVSFLAHVFMVHNFHPDHIFYFNPVFWSLALEEQFYFLFSLLSFKLNSLKEIKTLLVIFGIVAFLGHGLFPNFMIRFVEWLVGAYIGKCYLSEKMPSIKLRYFLISCVGMFGLGFLHAEDLDGFNYNLFQLPFVAIIFTYLVTKKMKRISLLAYLGRISFPLYLFHFPVIVWSRETFSIELYEWGASIIFSLLLAMVVHESFEKRILTHLSHSSK